MGYLGIGMIGLSYQETVSMFSTSSHVLVQNLFISFFVNLDTHVYISDDTKVYFANVTYDVT